MQAHTLGEVGIFGTILLRVSSGTTLPIYIKIGSHLTDWEQKNKLAQFFETRCIYMYSVYLKGVVNFICCRSTHESSVHWCMTYTPVTAISPSHISDIVTTCRSAAQRAGLLSSSTTDYTVSQKIPPWNFLTFFPEGLGIFCPNFTCLLYVPIYAGLQIFIQLSATLTKLCHIMRDHHNVETHAEWWHLIWHNFVTVGDKWIQIRILA